MRTRTENKTEDGVLYWHGIPHGGTYIRHSSTCKDLPTDPAQSGQYFEVLTHTYDGGRLNGGAGIRSYHNYMCDYILQHPVDYFEYDQTELDLWGTAHAASSNPSNSNANLTVSAAELHQLPSLLKFAGDTFIGTFGRAFLNGVFGWMPLIGDIVLLLTVAEQFDKRLAAIERLRKGESLSSKRKLIDRRIVGIREQKILNSVFSFIEGSTQLTMTLSGHTFCKWTPDRPTGLNATTTTDRILARQVALGLQFDAAAAWDLIPWSWLTDWCFNVGDYLQANRNLVGATLSEFYAATQCTAYRNYEIGLPEGATVDKPCYAITTRKMRTPLTLEIAPSMPLLSAGHIGILSALVASRVAS